MVADASTLTLHRALLRQAKGMLSAYEAWIAEQEVAVLATTLKRERVELAHTEGRQRAP